MQSALQVLKQHWGYPRFRDSQEQIIQSVLEGKDTIGLLPTGGGKSICYQVPALVLQGLTLVISPLLSLMRDQVEQLRARQIYAEMINSEISKEEQNRILNNCELGKCPLLYITPERMTNERFLQLLPSLPISLIAVDEAHCISQWGHDFRPAYLSISKARQLLPNIPILALTASATPNVIQDISKQLKLNQENVIRKSFVRDNLAYKVQHTLSPNEDILALIQKEVAPIIVYLRSRKGVETMYKWLNKQAVECTYYHAGLNPELKHRHYSLWHTGARQVMVATSAFGMGIDKPNVRLVIHADIPESIEAYFQEVGRAGRDGNTAHGILMYNETILQRFQDKINHQKVSRKTLDLFYKKLLMFLDVPKEHFENHQYKLHIANFCDQKHISLFDFYINMDMLQRVGLILYEEISNPKHLIRVLLNYNQILDLSNSNGKASELLKAFLRMYPGVTQEHVSFSYDLIGKQLGISNTELKEILHKMQQQRLVSLKLPNESLGIHFVIVDQYEKIIELYHRRIQSNFLNQKQKATSMVQLIQTKTCRSSKILSYFGEKHHNDCKLCDNCIRKYQTKSKEDLRAYIMSLKEKANSYSAIDMKKHLNTAEYDFEALKTELRYLIQHKFLSYTDGFFQFND